MQCAFGPGHVPIAAKLPPILVKHTNGRKTESSMQCFGTWIGQRVSRNDAMDILFRYRLEQD